MARGAQRVPGPSVKGAAQLHAFSETDSPAADRLSNGDGGGLTFFNSCRRRMTPLLRLFGCEDWNVGVIEQPAADIVRRGIREPVRWLTRPSRWEMLADPSCCPRPDGGLTLFAEWMDHRVGRGEIWAAEVPAGAAMSEASFRPLLAEPVHMSYPFPFIDEQGHVCLTAETFQAGNTPLWRLDGAQWRRCAPLFAGRPVVDPTLWRGPDRWWLFCTFQDDAPNSHLHVFHALAPTGPWQPHAANPVKRDPGSSRPAGPLFVVDGALIRPAQDCSRTYGEAVVLNVVEELDPFSFVETQVRRLEPVSGPFPHGLHTFCPAGAVTLIDGKRWRLRLPFYRAEWLRNANATRRRLADGRADTL
jgi:hypothetical protein